MGMNKFSILNIGYEESLNFEYGCEKISILKLGFEESLNFESWVSNFFKFELCVLIVQQ